MWGPIIHTKACHNFRSTIFLEVTPILLKFWRKRLIPSSGSKNEWSKEPAACFLAGHFNFTDGGSMFLQSNFWFTQCDIPEELSSGMSHLSELIFYGMLKLFFSLKMWIILKGITWNICNITKLSKDTRNLKMTSFVIPIFWMYHS
jgi:hypothetical protein